MSLQANAALGKHDTEKQPSPWKDADFRKRHFVRQVERLLASEHPYACLRAADNAQLCVLTAREAQELDCDTAIRQLVLRLDLPYGVHLSYAK